MTSNNAPTDAQQSVLEDKPQEETPPEVPKEESPQEEPKEESPQEEPKEESPQEEPKKEEPMDTPPEKEETFDENAGLVIEIKPCDDPLAMTVNQAYWRSWSTDRSPTCNRFEPSDIDDTTYTHLVYSFASISSDGHIEPWVGSWDEVEKYKEFNKVKERNPDIKTVIAVTEGIFYGAGMNPVTFNEVAETDASRIAFAQSVVSFLALYDFDGVDIDWDSPLDPDKGGSPDNFERFVLLVKEIRTAFNDSGEDYELSLALPATTWELLDFDVVGLSEYVDWFNLMSFDYHTPKNIPKTVGAHSDLKLIDSVVFELVKEIASTKFVLGMAAYGRTYTLADDRCKEIGCPFRSPGLGGCGNTPGFLPYSEIAEFMESNSYDELHQDVSSSSMVAVVNDDQMISYDDESTWAIKEAYAEMMCLRGVMLWSVDMLKATSSSQTPQKRKLEVYEASASIGLEGNDLLGCNLCDGFKLLSGVKVDYDGSMVSCSEIDSMISAVFISQSNDQCFGLYSQYRDDCCAKAPSKPCDICGADQVVLEDKQVHYADEDSKCGELTSSFLKLTEKTSFTCSLAKTALSKLCCGDACKMCDSGAKMNTDAVIEFEGRQVSCMEYETYMQASSFLQGSEACASSLSTYSDICCSASDAEKPAASLVAEPTTIPCNICHRDDVHHELKAEAMVEYKGASLSCVDVNSILAKSEIDGSEMCDATQSMLFEGCCFEKCTLCGDKSLKWDATVKYNNQILSCDEFSSLFSMSVIHKGSDQCDAMQGAYTSTCCYEPPTTPCNLCQQGSMTYEVNTHAFAKTRSGTASSHCSALSSKLAEREDEGSQKCMDSKSAHFSRCCTTLSISGAQTSPSENSAWNNWIADYMTQPATSGVSSSFMSLWTLLSISLIGIYMMC
jgi:chitinase